MGGLSQETTAPPEGVVPFVFEPDAVALAQVLNFDGEIRHRLRLRLQLFSHERTRMFTIWINPLIETILTIQIPGIPPWFDDFSPRFYL